MTIFGIII